MALLEHLTMSWALSQALFIGQLALTSQEFDELGIRGLQSLVSNPKCKQTKTALEIKMFLCIGR